MDIPRAAAAGLGLLDETSAVHELLPCTYGGLGESVGEVGGQLAAWVAAVTPAQVRRPLGFSCPRMRNAERRREASL